MALASHFSFVFGTSLIGRGMPLFGFYTLASDSECQRFFTVLYLWLDDSPDDTYIIIR
jgi:hypothetical protein